MFLRLLQRVLIFTFSATFLAVLTVGVIRVKQHGEVDDTPSRPVNVGQASAVPASTSGGAVTGQAISTPWGSVQVSVKSSGGKLVAIDTPKYPHSGPSVEARSTLIDQAITAGNANIQGVSGATYTSLAFKRSLENALAAR